MASVFASRANEFAALVEGSSTNGLDRHARLLEVVGQLQAVPSRAPRPEFVADLRERLMAEADTVLRPLSDEERARAAAEQRLRLPGAGRRTTRERRLALTVGSLALLTGAATVTVGSQVALPGDTLYPIKRALEGASTSLAVGDGETGLRVLAHATERLEETEGLVRRAEVDTTATESTLRDFTAQAQDGALLMTRSYADTRDESRISDLRDFTGDSLDRLAEIEPTLPDEARDELVTAAEAVVLIDDDARNTCPECGGRGVVDLPISLASSSLPLGADLDGSGLLGLGSAPSGGRDGSAPVVPKTILPTSVPSDLPTLLPTGRPTPTAGLPTQVPTSGGVPPAPVPTSTKTPLLPLPTLLPTALPTLLPTALPTLPLDPITSLLPLDPITSLLPLDPITSLLPLLPLGQTVVPDDLGAPSPTPLP